MKRKALLKNNFGSHLQQVATTVDDRPLRVLALDEARFGLKSWHRRRWCPCGHRPPWVVQDRYEWFWLYAAVEPAERDLKVGPFIESSVVNEAFS